MQKILLLILLLIFPGVAQGRPFEKLTRKIGGYVRTHRLLLATDAALIASAVSDAHYTLRCLHANTCIETNPLLHGHPSDLELWRASALMTGGLIVVQHLGYWGAGKVGGDRFDQGATLLMSWEVTAWHAWVARDNARQSITLSTQSSAQIRMQFAPEPFRRIAHVCPGNGTGCLTERVP